MIVGALRFLALYLALSVLSGAALLFQFYPHHPNTAMGWAALFAAAIPVTLFGEWVGNRVFDNRLANAIDQRTLGTTISWIRMGYALAATLLVGVIAAAAFELWRRLVL